MRIGRLDNGKLEDLYTPVMLVPPFATREPLIEGTVVFVATTILAVALAALVVAQGNIGALRDFAAHVATDDNVETLDQISDARLAISLREGGILAALIAAAVLAFRRRLVPALLTPPVEAEEAPRIDRSEATVAGFVVLAGMVLAGRNLDLPMRADEANTILTFGTKSLWAALSDYRSSGNHILHTLLVWGAHQMGGWNPVALRMPAFLGACLTLPAAWWFVRREYGPLAAVVATALVATSPLFLEYATNARGYSLLLLLFVLLLIDGEALTRRPDRRSLWAGYAVLIALGFLTIPIMAFPAAIVVVWMLLVRWRTGAAMQAFVARMAIWSVVALGLTVLLYTPALTVAGVEALLFNRYVRGDAWGDGAWQKVFAAHGVNWLKWHWATPAWAQVALLACCVGGVAAPRSSTSHRGIFPLAVVLGMAVVLSVKPVALSPRMTIFQLFAAMVVAGTGLAALVNAALARMDLRRSRLRRTAVLAIVGLHIFCLFAWWATRPGIAAWFASETGVSPNANALCAKVSHNLRAGDSVLACWPTPGPLAFCLSASGHALSRSAVDIGLPQMCRAFTVAGAAPKGRFFMFVDDAAYQTSPIGGPLSSPFGVRMMRRHLKDDLSGYELIAQVDGGEIYRLAQKSEPEK